jgi:acyl carrier protein
MDSIYPRLATLIASTFGIPEQQISPDATFEDLEFDSLALVELALTVQQEFGVEIKDDAITSQDTLARAAELIDITGVTA